MPTLTIKTVKKEPVEIQIPCPCFFRDYSERQYIGVLDDKTLVRLYRLSDYTSIINEDYSESESAKNSISEAYNTMHSCTEAEFFQAYDEIIESIFLHPKLKI